MLHNELPIESIKYGICAGVLGSIGMWILSSIYSIVLILCVVIYTLYQIRSLLQLNNKHKRECPTMQRIDCSNCGRVACIELHDCITLSHNGEDAIIAGTGKNIVYYGEKNEEYMVCPHCATVDVDRPIKPLSNTL